MINYHIYVMGGIPFGSTLVYILQKLTFPKDVAVLSAMVELRSTSELEAFDNPSGV